MRNSYFHVGDNDLYYEEEWYPTMVGSSYILSEIDLESKAGRKLSKKLKKQEKKAPAFGFSRALEDV